MLRYEAVRTLVIAGTALLACVPVFAQESSELDVSGDKGDEFGQNDIIDRVVWHGFRLDDQYELYIEHKNDTAIIQLRKWNRPPGGPFVWMNEETQEDESIIRFEDQIELLRIRAEVLIPSPPNYLKNPGQRYRITINGITVAPEYHKVFEVNAGQALAAVFSELNGLYNRVDGIYRNAVWYGSVVALRVLNQTAHLPAELPLGTIKSRAAQFRIQGDYLTRRRQPRIERFPTEAKMMQTYARSFSADPAVLLTEQAPEQRSKMTPTPAQMTATPVRAGAYRSKHSIRREELAGPTKGMASVHDEGKTSKGLGQPGKALTVPEHDYPAISAAQIESLDLLLGGTESPMDQRMNPMSAGGAR